jgi:hypothetical protein
VKVAELAVDMLVRNELIDSSKFLRAVELVSEEIFVRLCLNDYPPN